MTNDTQTLRSLIEAANNISEAARSGDYATAFAALTARTATATAASAAKTTTPKFSATQASLLAAHDALGKAIKYSHLAYQEAKTAYSQVESLAFDKATKAAVKAVKAAALKAYGENIKAGVIAAEAYQAAKDAHANSRM